MEVHKSSHLLTHSTWRYIKQQTSWNQYGGTQNHLPYWTQHRSGHYLIKSTWRYTEASAILEPSWQLTVACSLYLVSLHTPAQSKHESQHQLLAFIRHLGANMATKSSYQPSSTTENMGSLQQLLAFSRHLGNIMRELNCLTARKSNQCFVKIMKSDILRQLCEACSIHFLWNDLPLNNCEVSISYLATHAHSVRKSREETSWGWRFFSQIDPN